MAGYRRLGVSTELKPLGGLAGDAGDDLEVFVEVQDGEPGELCGGGDDEVRIDGARC